MRGKQKVIDRPPQLDAWALLSGGTDGEDGPTDAAGAVIDDAAVTPKYLDGFAPARELPIVWRIAMGSIRNKLLILRLWL